MQMIVNKWSAQLFLSIVSLIGLNLPDISTQPAGLERCEQYIIDTINKKKKQRKVRDSRKLISVCSFETKV